MSVPEGKRGERKLETLIKARELTVYTLRICTNQKVFLPQYQNALTNKLIDTGKVIRIINHENVRAERKRLCRMVNLAKQGKLTRAKVDACYVSWKAHAAKGNTFKLLRRMDAYYKGLW